MHILNVHATIKHALNVLITMAAMCGLLSSTVTDTHNTKCLAMQMQTSSGGSGIRVGMRSTGSSVSSFVSATTASLDIENNITTWPMSLGSRTT